MPGLLDMFEETQTKSDKSPVTQLAKHALVSYFSCSVLFYKCKCSIYK